jgi:hypothetical protein
MAIPSAFPVWLVGADGGNVLVLDANGYTAALVNGAEAFSPTTPAATIASDGSLSIGIVESAFSSAQVAPVLSGSTPLANSPAPSGGNSADDSSQPRGNSPFSSPPGRGHSHRPM